MIFLCNQRANYNVLAKKRPFWAKFGGVFRLLRDPNSWPGLPLWAPNLNYDSPLSWETKIQKVKWWCFSQRWPFWAEFGGVFCPQDPQCLTRMAPAQCVSIRVYLNGLFLPKMMGMHEPYLETTCAALAMAALACSELKMLKPCFLFGERNNWPNNLKLLAWHCLTFYKSRPQPKPSMVTPSLLNPNMWRFHFDKIDGIRRNTGVSGS